MILAAGQNSVSARGRLDPEVLARLLKAALRSGCRASRLAASSAGRTLIDLLAPGSVSLTERAISAEIALREATKSYGGAHAEAAELLLGLAPGAHGRLLKDRRRLAAYQLGVLPDTFRRHYEAALVWDIAFAVVTHLSRPAD